MLLIDSVALTLIVYWSLRNDGLTPGKPEQGWFRMSDGQKQPAKKPKRQAEPRRSYW